MLYEILMCSLFITFNVFDMISSKNVFSVKFLSQVQLVMASLADLFIFTQKGEELIRETELVRERIYLSKWFMLRHEIGEEKIYKSIRSLLVINMMNAKGKVIKAGGFYTMRFETYMNVSGKLTTRSIKTEIFLSGSQLQLLAPQFHHSNPEIK
jgi:7tm Odorant receptor